MGKVQHNIIYLIHPSPPMGSQLECLEKRKISGEGSALTSMTQSLKFMVFVKYYSKEICYFRLYNTTTCYSRQTSTSLWLNMTKSYFSCYTSKQVAGGRCLLHSVTQGSILILALTTCSSSSGTHGLLRCFGKRGPS